MLLERYVNRLKKPLSAAFLITVGMASFSFPTIFPLILFSHWILPFLVSYYFFMEIAGFFIRNPHQSAIRVLVISFSIVLGFLALFAFPHLYLFFNALSWVISYPFLTLTTFITFFEWTLRIFREHEDFSLLKILINPKKGIARLEELLESNVNRARQRLEQRVDNVAQAEDQLRNSHNLSLPDLSTRMARVLADFPPEARIDDRALYTKYWNMLDPGNVPKTAEEIQAHVDQADIKISYKSYLMRLRLESQEAGDGTSELVLKQQSLQQALQDKALAHAKTEATKQAELYMTTLTEEKKKAYQNYRNLVVLLSPIHGECPYSMEEVLKKGPENFYIVEKRYLVNHQSYAIPSRTLLCHTQYFMQIMEDKAQDPIDRDLFFQPNTYPNPRKLGDDGYVKQQGASYPTEYIYHYYHEIEGHAVCLELCEAMEQFLNPNLALEKEANLKKSAIPRRANAQPAVNNSSSNPARQRTDRTDLLPSGGIYGRRPQIQQEVLAAARAAQIEGYYPASPPENTDLYWCLGYY